MIEPPWRILWAPCCVYGERPADVGAMQAVELLQVEVRDRRERHPAGAMDDDVDATEPRTPPRRNTCGTSMS